MSSKTPSLRLAMAEHFDDSDEILAATLDALRSDNPDITSMRMIADMLDPQSKRGKFRLELKRRKGNLGQQDADWYDRVMRVGEILDEAGCDVTEAMKRAAMPLSDGGVGRSEPVVRQLLAAYQAHVAAQREE